MGCGFGWATNGVGVGVGIGVGVGVAPFCLTIVRAIGPSGT